MAFQKTMTSEGHFNQFANWKKPGRVAIKTLLDFAKFHPMAPVFPKKIVLSGIVLPKIHGRNGGFGESCGNGHQ